MHRCLTFLGVVALFAAAACAPDQSSRTPLAPTEPTAAMADQCHGALASQISKEQKDLFSGAALSTLQDKFSVIKSLCPSAFPQMMDYVKVMLVSAGLPASPTTAPALANHLGSITLYVTGNALVRSPAVFMGDGLVETTGWPGTNPDGGAAVLSPGDPQMTTYDGQAALKYPYGTTPGGPHLFTFEPKPASFCPSNLRPNTRCYDVRDYPHESLYSPSLIIAMCLRGHAGPSALIHQRENFGTEVLPEEEQLALSCQDTHASLSGWLRREAGPVGQVLARAVDFLAPRQLFADDVGESGSLGAMSPVGGALTVIFEDGFTANAVGPLANGTDPVVGDVPSSWLVEVTHPGFVNVQNGLGDLTGKVVVISQALGNCSACPTVRVLGTRINPSPTNTIGSYEITWSSLQNKPSVKEAPFVVLSATGAELARLSYVSENGQSLLRFNGAAVGTWTRDVAQHFRIIVNLQTLSGANSNTTTLAIRDANNDYQTVAGPVPFKTAGQTTMSTIGYVLTGIDAGVIAADNFLVRRLADVP
jgi:hypothetical protein